MYLFIIILINVEQYNEKKKYIFLNCILSTYSMSICYKIMNMNRIICTESYILYFILQYYIATITYNIYHLQKLYIGFI